MGMVFKSIDGQSKRKNYEKVGVGVYQPGVVHKYCNG